MSRPPGALVSVGLEAGKISDTGVLVWLNYLSAKLGKLGVWTVFRGQLSKGEKNLKRSKCFTDPYIYRRDPLDEE